MGDRRSAAARWSSQALTSPPTAPDRPPAPTAAPPIDMTIGDVVAPLSPRSHDQAVVSFAALRRLDQPTTFQLRTEDPRVAAIVMARGSLASARNPSAAITSRYPAARALVAAMDRALAAAPTPYPFAVAAGTTRHSPPRRPPARRA